MCQRMRHDWASRMNRALTPRLDTTGTHYISADGMIRLPRNPAAAGIANIAALGIAGIAPGADGNYPPPDAGNIIAYINYYNVVNPGPNIPVPAAGIAALEAASAYYPDPGSWKDLKALHPAGHLQ